MEHASPVALETGTTAANKKNEKEKEWVEFESKAKQLNEQNGGGHDGGGGGVVNQSAAMFNEIPLESVEGKEMMEALDAQHLQQQHPSDPPPPPPRPLAPPQPYRDHRSSAQTSPQQKPPQVVKYSVAGRNDGGQAGNGVEGMGNIEASQQGNNGIGIANGMEKSVLSSASQRSRSPAKIEISSQEQEILPPSNGAAGGRRGKRGISTSSSASSSIDQPPNNSMVNQAAVVNENKGLGNGGSGAISKNSHSGHNTDPSSTNNNVAAQQGGMILLPSVEREGVGGGGAGGSGLAAGTGGIRSGKLLTSVYPINQHWAWVCPPIYDATRMPKILAEANTRYQLPATTFASVMRCVTGDIRFNAYSVLFSRVLPMWVLFSIVVLLVVLFSSPNGGMAVMVFTLAWICMLLLGILFCIVIRKHLVIALRQSVKEANELITPHNLLLGVLDRGQLSCHKVVILFLYYELDGCCEDVLRLIRVQQSTSSTTDAVRPSLNEQELREQAHHLLMCHSQQYVKAYMKKQLLFPTRPAEGVSDFRPKHCAKSLCMCQFVEQEYFQRLEAGRVKRPWYEKLV